MKKFIVVTLCVLLLMVAAVPALAAEETTVTVTPSKTVVERGDTVDFTVSISGDVRFTSIMVDLNFDENVFEFVSSVDNNSTGGMLAPYTATEKEVGLVMMGGGSYTGQLQVLTFKVKDTAPIQATSVTSSAPQGTGADGGSITVKFQGASVSVDCEHTYGEWSKVDNNKHQRICSKCQTPQIEEHDWNDGTPNPAPGCESPGKIDYTCIICHTTKTEDEDPIGHAWDNACDTTCNNNCGTTRTVTHSYGSTWSSDASGHWHECTVCKNKKDSAAHTPGPAATEQAAQTCTVCAYEIAPAIAHVHEMSTEWYKDAVNHWHRCEKENPSCYHTEDKAKHDYDNDCDVDCNTCGYIRVAPHSYNDEWRANAQGHWHVCTSCNVQSEVYPHNPGPEATQDTPQICEDCNFTIKWPLSHVHDYGETWYGDDENHWQSCAECAEATAMEPHVWDEGETLAEGGMQYTCTVCEMQVVTDGPMPQPSTAPSTQGSTAPGNTQKPSDSEGDSRFPWEWAGVAAVVLLIVGIVLLVIEFIRSRKTNMHGKFSK